MSDSYLAALPSGLIIEIACSADLFVYTELFAGREYAKPVQDLFARYWAGGRPRVLDLGGNVGFFTLFTANELIKAGIKDFDIVAVEASETSTTEYLRRMRSQPVPALVGKVMCLQGLVGRLTGTAPLLEDPLHTLGYALKPGEWSPKATKDVPYINLNEYCPGPWDLIKCDVEGHEELFVENYRGLLATTQAVVMEVHKASCDEYRVLDLMHQYGFTRYERLRDEQCVAIDYWRRP